ncbi:MAG: hypothetical protein V5A66_00915 [Candidatus Thermoplasmatota archaeon]
MEEDDKSTNEKSKGLRFAPWIGTGFGLVVAGYLARYLLGLFSGMEESITPRIGNIFITIGIIVLVVTLTAEIFTEVKKSV